MMKTLKIGVTVALLGWLAWRTDWPHVAETFAGLQFSLWLAALGVYGVAQVLSSLRWQMLSRPLGFEQPLRHFLGFYFIGMFFNLLLPTSVGGDVVRAFYLARGNGRRLPATVSVVVDRLSGLAVLISLACGAVLFAPMALPPWVAWSVWLTTAAMAAGALFVWLYFLLPAAADRPARRINRKLAVLQSAMQTLQDALRERPQLLLYSTALSVGVQAANIVLVWLVGLAIGADIPPAYYWIVVPMVSLLQVVMPSLNGHGVREGGLILFLGEVGVASSVAVSLGFLWFSVMATAGLCGGLVYLFGRFPQPEVRANHDEPVGDRARQGRARQPAAAA